MLLEVTGIERSGTLYFSNAECPFAYCGFLCNSSNCASDIPYLSNAARKTEKHVFVDSPEACLCRDCDEVMYVRVTTLKRAGDVVRMFHNRVPNRILEGSF